MFETNILWILKIICFVRKHKSFLTISALELPAKKYNIYGKEIQAQSIMQEKVNNVTKDTSFY